MIARRDVAIYNTNLLREAWKYLLLKEKNKAEFLFKKALIDFLEGNNNVFLLGRGRQALHLAIDSSEYSAGDEVIVPNYYLKAIISLLKSKGLVVVPCDVDGDTLSNDLNDTLSKITESTKFVILSHMFGVCQDVDYFVKKVKEKKKDIVIIEDCAHSLGSEYKEKKLGLFGDFSFFSFNSIKNINTIEGGALVVNNEKYLQEVESNYGFYKKSSIGSFLKKIVEYYISTFVLKTPLLIVFKRMLKKDSFRQKIKRKQGGHCKNQRREKLSSFSCFLGYGQVQNFSKKQEKIEEVLRWYQKYSKKDIWDSRIVGENSAYSHYYLIFRTSKDIGEVNDFLATKGVDIGIKEELMDICFNDEKMIESFNVFNSAIQVPLYFSLTEKKVKKIAENLNEIM